MTRSILTALILSLALLGQQAPGSAVSLATDRPQPCQTTTL